MKHCLVIDDDFEVAALICEVLASHNYVSQSAFHGQQAIEMGLSKLSEFDLIFTDIKMPKMDGFEFIYAARELGIKAPIVAVTGLPDKGESLYLQDDGKKRALPEHIISKPFKDLDIMSISDSLTKKAEN